MGGEEEDVQVVCVGAGEDVRLVEAVEAAYVEADAADLDGVYVSGTTGTMVLRGGKEGAGEGGMKDVVVGRSVRRQRSEPSRAV